MRRKYTAEQLSRILGEHEAGTLKNCGGFFDWGRPGAVRACINQVAFNEPSNGVALGLWNSPANWFDANYDPD